MCTFLAIWYAVLFPRLESGVELTYAITPISCELLSTINYILISVSVKSFNCLQQKNYQKVVNLSGKFRTFLLYYAFKTSSSFFIVKSLVLSRPNTFAVALSVDTSIELDSTLLNAAKASKILSIIYFVSKEFK